MNEKSFLIEAEHLKKFFHWDALEGYYASDRITKEECKVGYKILP